MNQSLFPELTVKQRPYSASERRNKCVKLPLVRAKNVRVSLESFYGSIRATAAAGCSVTAAVPTVNYGTAGCAKIASHPVCATSGCETCSEVSAFYLGALLKLMQAGSIIQRYRSSVKCTHVVLSRASFCHSRNSPSRDQGNESCLRAVTKHQCTSH